MKVIQDMRGALIQAKGLKDDILPIISFPEWYSRLEDRAVNATSDELKDIVSNFIRESMVNLNIRHSLPCDCWSSSEN